MTGDFMLGSTLGQLGLYTSLAFSQLKKPVQNIWEKLNFHGANYQVAVYCDSSQSHGEIQSGGPKELDSLVTASYDANSFSYTIDEKRFDELKLSCHKKFSQ